MPTKPTPITMLPSQNKPGKHAARLMVHLMMKRQQDQQNQAPADDLDAPAAQVYKFPERR